MDLSRYESFDVSELAVLYLALDNCRLHGQEFFGRAVIRLLLAELETVLKQRRQEPVRG